MKFQVLLRIHYSLIIAVKVEMYFNPDMTGLRPRDLEERTCHFLISYEGLICLSPEVMSFFELFRVTYCGI